MKDVGKINKLNFFNVTSGGQFMHYDKLCFLLPIATRKNHQEIVAMIRHPPPVKKPTEQNRTGENGTVNVKAEINITHDSEESKHHHKKVIG